MCLYEVSNRLSINSIPIATVSAASVFPSSAMVDAKAKSQATPLELELCVVGWYANEGERDRFFTASLERFHFVCLPENGPSYRPKLE